MPLTSSVVQQLIARFLTFTAYKKSRFSLKRRSSFRTGAKIYLSVKNILGLGALSRFFCLASFVFVLFATG